METEDVAFRNILSLLFEVFACGGGSREVGGEGESNSVVAHSQGKKQFCTQ
jgi:hypothetical protein